MIPAAEALLLPTARLTQEERAAADLLEASIEAIVREKMERRGCDLGTKEARLNVIAEVNQRLKMAGYNPQWHPHYERSALNPEQGVLAGYQLTLAPSDEAYRAATLRGNC